MFRRAICLMLACQLLLMQGLLCRGCPLSGGQHGHAARPHIHTRQLLPTGQAGCEPQRSRCPCCQRRLAALEKGQARAVPQARAASQEKGEADDAVFLSCDPQAVSGSRNQAEADGASLDLYVSFVPADLVRLAAMRRQAALPPPWSGLTSPPLYLLNLTLLI